MLGKGGGNGITKPKAKIIITKPKPTSFMASIKSLTNILSELSALTTFSRSLVALLGTKSPDGDLPDEDFDE